MSEQRTKCAGCAVITFFPKECPENCPNIIGYNKFATLLANYHFISHGKIIKEIKNG